MNYVAVTASLLLLKGMFPYVCLATMPLFCHNDWPRRLWGRLWGWQHAPGSEGTPSQPKTWAWQQPEQHRELVLDAGCLLPYGNSDS